MHAVQHLASKFDLTREPPHPCREEGEKVKSYIVGKAAVIHLQWLPQAIGDRAG